jgi:hypothetical protein
VARTKSTLVDSIDDAVNHITRLFLQQCTYGAQTKALPSEFAACGQFIGEDAATIPQHGFHGISAALRVLGPCTSDECRALVQRLVSYCEACFGIHPTLTLERNDLVDDTENVIKLGELLYALAFVPAAQVENRLVRHVAKRLREAAIDNKGWGYFIGESIPQLLPTAYALRGLAKHGYDVNFAREFILNALRTGGQSEHSSASDVTTAIASIFCITFSSESSAEQTAELREHFASAWRALESLMGEDVEQNVEYWHGSETHYVRIPWQMYLLSLASQLSFWRFASFRSQTRLRALVESVRSDSFGYPYSGTHLSSRTNSIAYDILTIIRGNLRRFFALRVGYLIDRTRVIAGSRPVRVLASLIAAVIILYSIGQWWTKAEAADLAPKFVASILVWMLAVGRR